MNIVPFNAGQGGIRAFVQNALRAGRFLGPAAMNEAINLARQHGPDAYAWVRREVIRGGRRIFRGMRRREHGPMHNQNRGPYQLGPSESSSQVRRGVRGFGGRSRGGQTTRRGAMVGRRRYPMRTGGRYVGSVRAFRPELKAYDIGVTSAAVGNTISYLYSPWRELPLGVQSDQRVGRKVRVKGVTLSGRIHTNAVTDATTAADTVWLWVVMDRQANNNIAAVADIWSNSAGNTALRNLDQGPRFKIIKCIEIKMDFGQSGTILNSPFEAYIPLDTVVTWQGAANSNPYKNNLLLFASNSNVSQNGLKCTMISRVRFTDY